MIYFFNTEPNSTDIVKQLIDKYLAIEPADDEIQDLKNRLN